MDYPELIAEVTDRTGDSTVATRAALYLRLAEAEINKVLRIGGSEVFAELTTDSDGEVLLPDDFSAMRLVVLGGREVDAVDFPSVTLPSYGVRQLGYAVRGNSLVTSWPNTDLTLHYYAKVVPLDLTGTNWLIESDPEIYLYAMMKQVFMARLETEKAGAAQAVFDELIGQKKREDAIIRFGRKPFRAVGNVV